MFGPKSTLLQADLIPAPANIALLESSVLLPALLIIISFALVAGIVITVQKHKRY